LDMNHRIICRRPEWRHDIADGTAVPASVSER
jgi:hypothetical protein